MEKWTGDLAPPPFWLVPSMEVTGASEPAKLPRGPFVIRCIRALLNLGCDIDQALGVAANTMNETGWGRFYRAWNLGGWKITKGTSTNSDGTPRQWWRALGNKSSGDPQTCFYRAFSSAEKYFEEWLKTFVPKAGTGRYAKCGQQFWAGEEWFDDLIAAGYKGAVTQRNPTPSIREHEQIIKTLVVIYCQHLLGVEPDGKWGQKSRNACSAYQLKNGLSLSGTLNAETMDALLHGVKHDKTVKAVEPLIAQNPDDEVSELAT